MKSLLRMSVLLPSLLLAVVGSASDEVLPLRYDPFQLPDPDVAVPQTHARSSGQVDPAWVPELRATLVSENTSIANVNGTLLSPGDELQGYRLLKVEERRAIFDRAGQRMVLSLDD